MSRTLFVRHFLPPVLRKIPFLPPLLPTLAARPPVGPEWLHEAKLEATAPRCTSRTEQPHSGAELTKRFRALRSRIESIPEKSAIIDRELIACGTDGLPCFRTLMELGNKAPALCLWAFDLLYLDGIRITPMPLTQRKDILNDLVNQADDERLQFSGEFADSERLLAAGEETKLEGIVSKRRDSAYRLGKTRD